jgi:hypothetical protein
VIGTVFVCATSMKPTEVNVTMPGAGLQKVNGERVARRMRRNRFVDTGSLKGLTTGEFDGEYRDRLPGLATWEEPLFRVRHFSVRPQNVQRPGR